MMIAAPRIFRIQERTPLRTQFDRFLVRISIIKGPYLRPLKHSFGRLSYMDEISGSGKSKYRLRTRIRIRVFAEVGIAEKLPKIMIGIPQLMLEAPT